MDPANTAMLKEVLLEQSQTGCTVVFSSHRMDQVEELCEDIVLIHRGEPVLSGNLQRIKSAMGRQILRVALEGRRRFLAPDSRTYSLGRSARLFGVPH